MSFCSNCGTQNEDSTVFCENCGTKVEVDSTKNQMQQSTYQQAPPQQQYQHQNQYNNPQNFAPKPIQPRGPLSQNSVVNTLKSSASATLFLATVITFSVMTFFSLINAFIPNDLMDALFGINGMLDKIGFGSIVGGALGFIQGIFTTFTILGLIPTILICVGMWMFYASSIKFENRSTAGITMIKTVTIINLIGLIIIFIVLSVFVASVIALILVLPIMYYISIIATTNKIKTTLQTGVPLKISGFVAVMNFIIAFISLIGMFFTGGFSIVVTLINVAFLVMVSVGIFSYNNLMINHMYNQNTTNINLKVPQTSLQDININQ